MKFGGSRGQLDDALKVARGRWQAVCELWDDQTRREHEAEVVQPLDDLAAEVLRAVDQLITVFTTARHDCEFEQP